MSSVHTGPHSATSSNEPGAPETAGATFVEWVPGMPGGYDAIRKTAPRLHHKKSRTGCQQCKARRVKLFCQTPPDKPPALTAKQCDETHPICGGCRRNHHSCVYNRPAIADTVGPSKPEADTGDSAGSTTALGFPESRKRRLLELKLLHRYITTTSTTMLGAGESILRETFASIIPSLAFEHDTLLYSIYAVSALHLAKDEPRNLEALDAYQKYLGLTLREHRSEVARLSKANADAACLTSTFLRICAFAMLQERPLSPYTPPSQWLQMTSGSVNVFRESWAWIVDDEASVARRLIMKRTPMLVPFNETLFQESNRQGLLHLLRRGGRANDTSEPWDTDIEEAYKSTLSYLGGIQIAIAAHEAPTDIGRRIIIFPMMVKKRFIQLIEERQPRALVVLAHFFALLARFSDFWWLGDTGKREIRGIQTVLPGEWQDLMSWPLAAMEEGSLLLQKRK